MGKCCICDRVELKNGVAVLGGCRVKRDFKTPGDVTACLNDKNDVEGETSKVRKAMMTAGAESLRRERSKIVSVSQRCLNKAI